MRRRRGRPVVALGLLVLSVGAVAAAEVVVEPPTSEPTDVTVAPGAEAVSGRSVCVVGDARTGTDAAVDLVRPGAAGDPPASADLAVVGGGEADPLGTVRLFPGGTSRAAVEGDGAAATDVRWAGAPVGVARSWRLEGEEDLPPGTAAGPCAPGTAATTWTVPGLTTAGGAEARLRLANPHAVGATVVVGFLTPEGPQEPTRLRNVSVGARETVELELNEYLPEEPDLAVVVEVASGRVAVEGVQLVHSAIGGIDGVSLLRAATDPAETWTVPLVVGGDERASWLWIANRTDRSAPVELTYHTPDGGAVPQLLSEVSVPPGTVRRVDLVGTLPEGVESAALTARSDGVPVVVSGVAEYGADEPAATGMAVQLAAPATDPVWTLAGTIRPDRREQLRLINPGSEPATVDVSLWDGTTSTTPAELTGLEVPPGAIRSVPFHELLSAQGVWSLTVTATSGEVVAASVGSGDETGARHLVATVGSPSSWWRTDRTAVLRPAPGTVQRLGTELGIEPANPLAPDAAEDQAPDLGGGVGQGTGTDDEGTDLDDDGAEPDGR